MRLVDSPSSILRRYKELRDQNNGPGTTDYVMNCQNHLYRNISPQSLARRWFLKECGVGLGAIALRELAGAPAAKAAAEPLAARRSPIQARAKNVIFLFMA